MKKEIVVKGNKIVVSDDGKIFSTDGKEKSQFENSSGYMYVALYNDDHKRSNLLVHRLVARAFLDNPKGLPQVNHKDLNTKNNCLSNLEYCSARYNNLYHGKPKRVLDTWVSRGRTVRIALYKDGKHISDFVSIRSSCKYTEENSIKVANGLKENHGVFEFNGYTYKALNKAYKGKATSKYIYHRKTTGELVKVSRDKKTVTAMEMTGENFLGLSMENELWEPIAGYDNQYYISNFGRVSTRCDNSTHYRLKYITKDRNGYMLCNLYKDGVCSNFLIHRLVAKHFVNNSDEHMFNVVHHKDHNRSNNKYSNIMWTTQEENMIESVINKNGTFKDCRRKFKKSYCKECGKEISYGSKYCKDHYILGREPKYKNRKLGKNEIKESLIRNKGNFTKASKEFLMTDNALRKWCKKYGLGSHSSDWK